MNTGDTESERRVVFLTGANGFVGSHIVRALLDRKYRIRALTRPKADCSRIEGLDVERVIGDLDDVRALREGVRGADFIIHNAGRVRAPSPEAYHHANCLGTIKLLDAVEEAAPNIRRFVYVSSQAAGGPSPQGRPKVEDDPNVPHTPYGESKLAGEQAVMARASKLPVVTVRPPAVYGPEDTAILAVFQTVGWHIKPLFGPQPQHISVVHVQDLVSGILLAMESDAASGQTFFIAEDRPYTLAEMDNLIQQALKTWAIFIRFPAPLLMSIAWTNDMIGKAFGFVPRLNRDKARDFLARNWTCSTEKARRLLGYKSQIAFAEGAKMTAQWYRARGWL